MNIHWAGEILAFFYRRKWLGLGLLLLIFSFAVRGIFLLEVESDTRKFLPQNTLERKASQLIQERYGIDAEMIVVYRVDEQTGNAGSPEVLGMVRQLVEQLQENNREENSGGAALSDLDEFDDFAAFGAFAEEASLIQDMEALSTLSIMRSDGRGGLEEIELASLSGSAAIRQALRDWQLYDQSIYSDDFRYGAIIIQPRPDLTARQQRKLYQNILATLESFSGQGLQFFLSGEAAMQNVVGAYIFEDLLRLLPLLGLIICAVLYAYFRHWTALLIILFPVLFALLGTIGLMGWLGVKFTFIHASIPVIIMALGSADAIHTLSHFSTHSSNTTMLERIRATQRKLFLPVTLTRHYHGNRLFVLCRQCHAADPQLWPVQCLGNRLCLGCELFCRAPLAAVVRAPSKVCCCPQGHKNPPQGRNPPQAAGYGTGVGL
ncbi:MAG: MMPL family transporter [Spirochaetota bacterium]